MPSISSRSFLGVLFRIGEQHNHPFQTVNSLNNTISTMLRSSLRLFGVFVFAAVLSVSLVGCDSGGGMEGDVSPEEASEQIETAFEGISDQAGTLEEGGFSSFMTDFLGAANGSFTSSRWVAQLTSGVAENIVVTTDGRFDFEATAGEYAWDAAESRWEEVGTSDDVILRFPSSEGTEPNDATLALREYGDEQVTIEGEETYLPTNVDAALTVGEEEVFSVRLSGVEYIQEDPLALPTSFTLEILTAPHTHTFTLAQNSSTDFEFGFELRGPDEIVAGITTQALLTTDEYAELEGNDVEELSGQLRLGPDVEVPYTIQVGELSSADDPSEEQINNLFDATVEYQGTEVASLRYDEEIEGIEVVYSDGSTESASDFFEPFLDELESAFSDFIGDNGADLDQVIDGATETFYRP